MRRPMLCPTCRKETTWEGNRYRPFCSERCATMDLGRWADGKHAIAGEPAGDGMPPEHQEPDPHDSKP